jgi:hypothetical protein
MKDDYDNFKKKKTKNIKHPCEDVFNIDPESTEIQVSNSSTELIKPDNYDSKDVEIENQYQEIFDKSMDFFDELTEGLDSMDGKFKARTSEVAATFLQTALNSIKEKAKLKNNKDSLSPSQVNGLGVVNNTQINVSTTDIIKMLSEQGGDLTNNNIVEVNEPIKEEIKPKRKKMKVKKTKKNNI